MMKLTRLYKDRGSKMVDKFELVSSYKPEGDQPRAIEQLVNQVNEGNNHLTLLGATGTGKTFTVSNVIEQINRPTLVIAHNKTLAEIGRASCRERVYV